jgi:hypothetical protein
MQITISERERIVFIFNAFMSFIMGCLFMSILTTHGQFSDQWTNTWFHLIMIMLILLSFCTITFALKYSNYKYSIIFCNIIGFLIALFCSIGYNIAKTQNFLTETYITLANTIITLYIVNKKCCKLNNGQNNINILYYESTNNPISTEIIV